MIIAVTVAFVGLVHFYKPTPTFTGREVILPLAKGTSGLIDHQLDIVITGLKGGETDCTTLGGKWAATATCTLEKVSGKIIKLPGTSAFDETSGKFDKVPRLQNLCEGITGINDAYLKNPSLYAARLTITHGTLDADLNVKAWVSTLTTEDGIFSIGTTTTSGVFATLNPSAVVTLINSPTGGVMGMPLEHFGWYYRMYRGAEMCMTIPPDPTAGPRHRVVRPPGTESYPGAAGDIGCSNTGYP